MKISLKTEKAAHCGDAEGTITGPSTKAGESERREPGPDRRESVIDRRSGLERRQQLSREQSGYKGSERRVAERRMATGLDAAAGRAGVFPMTVRQPKRAK